MSDIYCSNCKNYFSQISGSQTGPGHLQTSKESKDYLKVFKISSNKHENKIKLLNKKSRYFLFLITTCLLFLKNQDFHILEKLYKGL